MVERTWTIVDHICRSCGGRVLKCATGTGMTPGGNPLWRCADCGKQRADMFPSELCWCGFGQRGSTGRGSYMCVSGVGATGQLLEALRRAGWEPNGRSEVGIALTDDLRAIDDGSLEGRQ